ncbi:class I SAM-dependent methyltransferase [Geobacter sp. AOG2]|uniref:class I SAM-dependent methyltransferase n=1 Tax=Geobacter sp. AOG2 TaxID=1566347 RepID=UPI001CC6446C|nr:class I SAM-dependent methyltransferase [Geobacter sp. AOG2]GFE59659.1 hypothetical protein AOG2_02470 [Geobacter sp. AOG2]
MTTNLDIIPLIKQFISPEVATVLDVGCGFLDSHYDLYEHDLLWTCFAGKDIVGIDAFGPNIQKREQFGPKGVYLEMMAEDIDVLAPRDLVICHHVLEHLSKDSFDKVMKSILSLAKKQIIIGGPIGYVDNSYHVEFTGNQYEKHEIGLDPEYFKKLGFKVYYLPPVFIAFMDVAGAVSSAKCDLMDSEFPKVQSNLPALIDAGNTSDNGSTEGYTVVYDKDRMLESIWVAHYLIYQKFIQLADKSITIDICSGTGAGTKLISEYTEKPTIGVDYSADAIQLATANNSSVNTDYYRLDLNEYQDICKLKDVIRNGKVKQAFFIEGIEHLKFPYEIVLSLLEAGVEKVFISTPIVHDNEVNDEHFHITPFTDSYSSNFFDRFKADIVSYCKYISLDTIKKELDHGYTLDFFMGNYFTDIKPKCGNYLIKITQ